MFAHAQFIEIVFSAEIGICVSVNWKIIDFVIFVIAKHAYGLFFPNHLPDYILSRVVCVNP